MASSESEKGATPPDPCGTETAAASASKARSRYLPWWKKAVFALVAVCLFFGVLELSLAVLFSWTGTSFPVDSHSRHREKSDYPARPEEHIKIAVFGGSAAAGAFAWSAFHNVVFLELTERFPNKKFYVKNYALSGYPFHKHQAEYVKRLIDKYDFVLIYCGNNEAENWFDESGYWRYPEYKHARELDFQTPVDADPTFLERTERMLHENSRIYALFELTVKKTAPLSRPPTRNRRLDYQEFEEADALPAQERKNIVTHFEKDLEAICKLAENYETQVLISVSATYETWPPCFSFFRRDITAKEKSKWQELYQEGLDACQKQDYKSAIAKFLAARAIDSGVAILNHRLGKCYLESGDPSRGRRFLRQAIDQDGYYSRSITPLHRKAKELSAKYVRLHYVDTVAAFHTVMEGAIKDEDLFADICHPSFLGHVIIGNVFTNKLLELAPFCTWDSGPRRDVGSTDWKSLADSYVEKFGISDFRKSVAATHHINWYFDMAHWTAYREQCYEAIEKLISQVEEMNSDSPDARALAKVYRGRLAVARTDYPLAVQMLNEALQISPPLVHKLMNTETFSQYVISEFQAAGIEFSSQQGKYVKR